MTTKSGLHIYIISDSCIYRYRYVYIYPTWLVMLYYDVNPCDYAIQQCYQQLGNVCNHKLVLTKNVGNILNDWNMRNDQ